jgi:NADPH:quinone reductase-like Zn-dependent oxidoreductase
MASTKMNRAILYSEPPTIKTHVEELPIQKPGPGEVLVRLLVLEFQINYGFRRCVKSWMR